MPLALFGKRRTTMMVPQTRLRLAKTQVRNAAERVGPMAAHAREAARHAANERIIDARGWAAPRLDAAAHAFEDQLAPRITAMLSQAASRVDPNPQRSRRWPMLLLLTGLAAGAAGVAMYRKNAGQWSDSVKGSAADASHWVSDKARTAADKVSGAAGGIKNRAEEFGHKADPSSDEFGNKISTETSQASRNI
ncbi:hypothetical protein Plo01_16740 [Planobispora longispora]|uniref:YtxH domain-containing protein n=2 Tax=Planobispora longispora TaxID=28887 RepID=A0A8J3W4A5_9ACTN|nr:hypothetical protein GCM10020093_076650 [Planobispora longispora]GIH75245.1 hypothetical protein Plo01_16740 [Planobispora longispora]